MVEMDGKDMDAVERSFEEEECRERILDICSGVLTVVGALAFLALCWWLIHEREAADRERRTRNPQGAEARVERRFMETDPAYRLCRKAARAVLALPGEAAR